jgi:hypothetical protein
VGLFLETRISLVFIIFSLCLGVFAIVLTPREEEPQITVPWPTSWSARRGASAGRDSNNGGHAPGAAFVAGGRGGICIFRVTAGFGRGHGAFFVGEDREESLVQAAQHDHDAPGPGAAHRLKLAGQTRQIARVPIVDLTLSSKRYDEYDLRRIGEECSPADRDPGISN